MVRKAQMDGDLNFGASTIWHTKMNFLNRMNYSGAQLDLSTHNFSDSMKVAVSMNYAILDVFQCFVECVT